MNTLSTFYRSAIENLLQRFTAEQLVVIFDGLRTVPRALVDSNQLPELCGAHLPPEMAEPIVAEMRKFSAWEAACMQLWVYAYWDDFGGKSPFESSSGAGSKSRQTQGQCALREVQALMSQASKFLEECPIGNPRVGRARETGLEAQGKIDHALAEL
jgi:hypothetical protein